MSFIGFFSYMYIYMCILLCLILRKIDTSVLYLVLSPSNEHSQVQHIIAVGHQIRTA